MLRLIVLFSLLGVWASAFADGSHNPPASQPQGGSRSFAPVEASREPAVTTSEFENDPETTAGLIKRLDEFLQVQDQRIAGEKGGEQQEDKDFSPTTL